VQQKTLISTQEVYDQELVDKPPEEFKNALLIDHALTVAAVKNHHIIGFVPLIAWTDAQHHLISGGKQLPILRPKQLPGLERVLRSAYPMEQPAMKERTVFNDKILIKPEVIETFQGNWAIDPYLDAGNLKSERIHVRDQEERYVVIQALHETPRRGLTRLLAAERHAVIRVSSIVSLTSFISGF